MKKTILLVLSVSAVSLLSISLLFPFSQNLDAKSTNLAAYEEFAEMSDEEKIKHFLNESPQHKSEIYRGLLETQASNSALNPAQQRWIQEALEFHNEQFFSYIEDSVPIRNYEEFRKTKIMSLYEQLQLRKNELFTEDIARNFCLDSTLTDGSSKMRVFSSSDGSSIVNHCSCTNDTMCSTGCASGFACNQGGCQSGTWGCGCVWHVPCTNTCGAVIID